MPDGLIYLLIFIAVVVIYTIAKVVDYMRQSEQQWKQVDKSKLKEWEDDEDKW
jgi:type III secretory pathway component EscU